jgi:beta-phosphoglucomutase
MDTKPSAPGVIFDLDGVIVSTDEHHYQAWKRMADEQGLVFDRHTNERLRGVSRMESLEIILSGSKRSFTDAEKTALADTKNRYYREALKALTPADLLPGVTALMADLKAKGIPAAIGSSSKNTPFILEKIGLAGRFEAVADGNDIKRSKPDPEVFLLAAQRLGKQPRDCIVVEDAVSGVEAALAGGMRAVAVGTGREHPGAHLKLESLAGATAATLLRAFETNAPL